MSDAHRHNYEWERQVEEDLLASEIILDLQRNSKVEIKRSKLITIKIIFMDDSEIFYRVSKTFFNKRLKRFLNIMI